MQEDDHVDAVFEIRQNVLLVAGRQAAVLVNDDCDLVRTILHERRVEAELVFQVEAFQHDFQQEEEENGVNLAANSKQLLTHVVFVSNRKYILI